MKRIVEWQRAMIILLAVMIYGSASLMADDSIAVRYMEREIPDSMRSRIIDVLEGRAVIVDRAKPQSDMVIVRGDTISEILTQRNFGRFDRGLFNYIFIPRGQWQLGVTASYGEFSSQDYQLFDILGDFDFSGHTFSIKPYMACFIGNNQALGLRLGYTQSRGDLGTLAVDFDEDLSFSVNDVMYRAESYQASMFYRSYLGLARRGRFGVYNEISLAFSSGNSDFRRYIGGSPINTHTTNMEAKLSFSPGVCVFINQFMSFNIDFAVVGFYLRNEKQWINEEPAGNRFSSGANFRFNLFNINFGLGVHI